MKLGSLFVVALPVVFAAVRLAPPSTSPRVVSRSATRPLVVGTQLPPLPPKRPKALIGGCTAYLPDQPIQKYPGDENRGAATDVITRFFGGDKVPGSVRYAIALAPDPAHTNLSLMFDREISIVQQAAGDQGYLYDSSWMPWKPDPAPPLGDLPGRQQAADLTDAREACPGVILFRGQGDRGYSKGLVVLVVGEQATGGINDHQWANAVQWLSDKESDDHLLRILGPTFSGSVVSLERNLRAIYAAPKPNESKEPKYAPHLLARKFPDARILSGSVSGCSSIQWFQKILHTPEFGSHQLEFGTFQENEALHTFRLVEYLKSQHTDPKDIAILSEDETAYAALPTGPIADDGCTFHFDINDRPVNLVYPRDISALRDAYEKESVFDAASTTAKEHAIHPILRDVGGSGAGNGEIKDTVPAYSGAVSAIAQEAYLFGIVSFLRTHHTRYLVLRSTNPLDFMFLTRFFHRFYPEARIVTLGSDILFRREIDTTEFRGVLALTSYPILPRAQHWSKITEDNWDNLPHDHLVFQSDLQEGEYIATRYLLQPPTFGKPLSDTPITLSRTIPTPDYAEPFWRSGPDLKLSKPIHPPTWLIAVGRDGYWPVAVLNQTSDSQKLAPASAPGPPSTMVQLQPEPKISQHYELEPPGTPLAFVIVPVPPWIGCVILKPAGTFPAFSHRLLVTLPLPWVGCVLTAFLLACYHCFGMYRGHGRSSDGLLSTFARVDDPSQKLILGASAALSILPLTVLLCAALVPDHLFDLTNSATALKCWLALAALLAVCMLLAYAQSLNKDKKSGVRARLGYIGLCFVSPLAIFTYLIRREFGDRFVDADLIPRFYRMVHITDGVSPLFPILLLACGFYLWAWQTLAGNLILSNGCPTLPEVEPGPTVTAERPWQKRYDSFLGRSLAVPDNVVHRLPSSDERISQNLGRCILRIASPFGLSRGIVLMPFAIVGVACLLFWGNLPLLSLEGSFFNFMLNLLLLAALIVTMVEALRLYSTWVALRKLLHALARLRLRRTIARLRRIEANSLWSVSGNVRRFQYGIFIQQLEAADRFTALRGPALASLANLEVYGEEFIRRAEEPTGGAPWNGLIVPPSRPYAPFPAQPMRQVLSEAVAEVFCWLEGCWALETDSLNLELAGKETDDPAADPRAIPLSKDKRVQAAEEFVAFHYIAFIQNIVARIRTITLSMMLLFVSVCLAISFYPFVPRTEISVWMIVNLALIVLAVAYVYAGMDRDEILSYIANTHPGRLGSEFYVKLAAFLIGPILGILTTQFPAIADTAMQLLQPGLDAIH